MREQNSIARQHDYSFLRTSSQVRRFVDLGLLVKLPGNADYELAKVSFPYARPAVKLFIERLARQYHAACGERLVVTSLTRPEARQPRNASNLSVHPAGMAVDLRVSRSQACRSWLESTLLSLEKQNVLDATRERYPPHYHVAVFPQPYEGYVAALERREARLARAEPEPAAEAPSQVAPAPAEIASADIGLGSADEPADVASAEIGLGSATEPAVEGMAARAAEPQSVYEVRPGDTLWGIARRFGMTVDALKAANGLGSARIMAGQTLTLAAAESTEPASVASDAAAAMVAAASTPTQTGGPAEPADVEPVASRTIRYEVRPGDTLWDIARRYDITVDELKSANGLASARIKAGQSLAVPSP